MPEVVRIADAERLPAPVVVPCYQLEEPGQPLSRNERVVSALGPDEALVRVAGCGICHTDLGYIYDGVKTRHPLPLTLGHEIAGTVEAAGASFATLAGKKVIVPAVIPCGTCELCTSGREMICRAQVFPGCDVHGGFASHLVVPAGGLCVVDDDALAASEVTLAQLAVLGDAISTPYHAIERSGLGAGDVAIFLGAGGVGGFGAQIARARGAHVFALDVDDARLEAMAELGVSHTLNVRDRDGRAVRKELRSVAVREGLPDTCWRIFETSGTAAGQETAFALLNHGAHLSVVGYTLDRVTLRLSNLMAFDATAQGVWGCPPRHYPAVRDLVLGGAVRLGPFITERPMGQVNETLAALRSHSLRERPVMIPDFDGGAS